MAKYIMRELPEQFGRGKRRHAPRMLVEGTVTLGQLAERIARGTTFASAEIEGIVALLVDELSGSLADGYTVRIEGLGAFSPTEGILSPRRAKEDDAMQRVFGSRE